jgi:hypothetical protein
MPTRRKRRLKASDVASILWHRASLIRSTLSGNEPYPKGLWELVANAVVSSAIESQSAAPILDAGVEVRVIVLARITAFIAGNPKQPDKVIARVASDADDGVLLAEALKVLLPQKEGSLRMLLRWIR